MITPQKKRMGLLSLLIVGTLLTAGGGAMAWFFGHDTTLHAQRDQNQCRMEQVNMFGQRHTVKEFPLTTLQAAEVAHRRSTRSKNKGSRNTYQVQLRTNDGVYAFSRVWTSDAEGHQQRAKQINDFLASRENTLEVTQSGKIVRLIGYGVTALGLLLLIGFVRRLIRRLLLGA